MCPANKNLLAYYDGELNIKSRLKIEKHLINCDKCKRYLKKINNLSIILNDNSNTFVNTNNSYDDIKKLIRHNSYGNINVVFQRSTKIVASFLLVVVGVLGGNLYSNYIVNKDNSIDLSMLNKNSSVIILEIPSESYNIYSKPSFIEN